MVKILGAYTNERKLQLLIMDFCQSGTFIKAPWIFKNGEYLKNPRVDKTPFFGEDSDTVINISAAEQTKNSQETYIDGGELTHCMMEIFSTHRKLTMNIIDEHVRYYNFGFVLSTNRQIDPNVVFFSLI